MNKQELQERIKEVQEEFNGKINELKIEVEKMEDKPKTVWDLEYGDDYCFIDFGGNINNDVWGDTDFEIYSRSVGNIFLTEQEGGNEIRKRKLIAKAKKSQEGYKPDWDDEDEYKWLIGYNHDNARIHIGRFFSYNDKPELGYWETEEQANKFVDDNRDELKWYFTECE